MEERLRTTGLTTTFYIGLIYNILKAFEGTDELKFFQRRVGSTRGYDLKLFKKEFK